MNLKDIIDKPKQSIDVKNYEHPTSTLATTLLKPVGEANSYVRLGYVPQTFSITPNGKYQDQRTTILSTVTSQINNKLLFYQK